MSLSMKILWSVMGIILGIAVITLSIWEIPAPSVEIRKSVSTEQFFKPEAKQTPTRS